MSKKEKKQQKKQIRKHLEELYPDYKDLHNYLSKVLFHMGYQIGDPVSITIVNPDEPTTISITIEPKYTS